jgi:hypothetical protein
LTFSTLPSPRTLDKCRLYEASGVSFLLPQSFGLSTYEN